APAAAPPRRGFPLPGSRQCNHNGYTCRRSGAAGFGRAFLLKQKKPSKIGRFSKGGGETRNRTGDTRIFSALLYQLSYLAVGGGRRGRVRRDLVNKLFRRDFGASFSG